MFVDSHNHISRKQFDETFPCIVSEKESPRIKYYRREELIEKMKSEGCEFIIEPAVELESNEKLLALAKEYPDFIYPAIGVHPTRSFLTKWKSRKALNQYADEPGVIAIGELGLDYHYDRKEQHRLKQLMWFIYQINLAHKRELPLILHIRNAEDDAIRIMRLNKKKIHGGVCHCFCSGPKYAKIYTEELGLHLGIGAAVLQENSGDLVEAVRVTPLDKILLETDAPYVKPDKPEDVSRKQWIKARNSSLIIPDIAAKVAEIKGVSVAEVERITTENVRRLFDIQ